MQCLVCCLARGVHSGWGSLVYMCVQQHPVVLAFHSQNRFGALQYDRACFLALLICMGLPCVCMLQHPNGSILSTDGAALCAGSITLCQFHIFCRPSSLTCSCSSVPPVLYLLQVGQPQIQQRHTVSTLSQYGAALWVCSTLPCCFHTFSKWGIPSVGTTMFCQFYTLSEQESSKCMCSPLGVCNSFLWCPLD